MGAKRADYRVLVEKLGEIRPVGSPRHRGEDNIKTDLQGVGRGYGLVRGDSVKRQVAGTYECCTELSGFIKCLEFLD